MSVSRWMWLVATALLLAPMPIDGTLDAQSAPDIVRLDGSRISAAAADSFARRTLAERHVTGAQIAVMNGGRLVWSAAYGRRQASPDLPMQRTTTTWAASITKAVFATYVMQLVEQGVLDLDMPVTALLPQPLDQYEPYRQKAEFVVKDSAWRTVTPRMLLSHTSGLANFASLEPDGRMRLHSAPGASYRYSGEGINLLQLVVEQRLGRPLDSLMQAAIFAPVGMSHTEMVFRGEFAADIADRFGVGEQFLAKTRRSPTRAAGSMTSTAEDLIAFASALFDDRLVSARTRAEMLRPQVRIHSLHQFGTGADATGGREAESVGLAYGLGWGLLTSTRFGPAFFKEGHGDGAQTYLVCFERQRTCMAILTNSDNGELAFRPLLETILGATVIPWEWEGYTPEYIEASRVQSH